MLQYTTFDTPFWEVIVVGGAQGVTNLHMVTGQGNRQFCIEPAWTRNDAFFDDVRTEVLEYCAGQRREFSVDLNPQGTEFQKRTWRALTEIPFGEIRTYKEIATALGNPNSSRAVGLANSKNPIPIIVPCHRVIGSNGKLTGFAHGLDAKERLLKLETRVHPARV
jgi:methylated-DNA-[protein]-cysteine S-methyltransferase